MKRMIQLAVVGFVLTFCVACSSKKGQDKVLTVYAAASLTEVIQEIGQAYEKAHGVRLTYNFASSGALAQQIMAAPRADIFISASQRWMNDVEKDGKVLAGTRETLLLGQLVVVGNAASAFSMTTPQELPGLKFTFLAVGDPDSVPAGRYAKQWLEAEKLPDGGATVWSAVESRLSLTNDVRAAMAQAETRRDIVAIIYRTDYQVKADSLRLIYALPVEQKPKIEYSAAVIAQGGENEQAGAFLTYLREPQSQAVFEKYGFIMAGK